MFIMCDHNLLKKETKKLKVILITPCNMDFSFIWGSVAEGLCIFIRSQLLVYFIQGSRLLCLDSLFLIVYWKNWCWSWNVNTLATWCEELTPWERPWCWEKVKAGGEGDDRGWDGWVALPTRWTWVWASSGSWWWTGKPDVLLPIESQRVGYDWVTEMNWMELNWIVYAFLCEN